MSDPAPTSAPVSSPADDFDRLLADFRTKYPDGDVVASKCSLGEFIVRTPDEGDYATYITNRSEPGKAVDAQIALCTACILHPSPAVVARWFAKKPGLTRGIADFLLTKAGAAEEIAAKK